MVYFVPSSTNFAKVSTNLNFVSILNDTNFKDCKENVVIDLGCMYLDLILRIEQPPSPTNSTSSEENKFYEK